MIVVNVTGGFANQLYRYACGYALSKKYNQELMIFVLDKNWYVDAYLLDELNIPFHRKIIVDSILAKEELKDFFHIKELYTITEKNFDEINEETFIEHEIVFVDAAFQRRKHYIDVLTDIRRMFLLKEPSEEIAYFQKLICGKSSVAVHLRRCDFVYHSKVNDEFTYSYNDYFYQAAIAYCEEILENPFFYVFSDDIEFSKNLLGNRNNLTFIDIIGGKDADIEEFFCISLCHYRILTAGSSFGRMADILNSEKNKKTIYAGDRENTDEIIYLNNKDIIKYSTIYKQTFSLKANVFQLDHQIFNINPNKLGRQELKKSYDAYFDAGSINKEQRIQLFLIKGICQYNCNDFIHAEMTLRKAWQFCNGKKEFHLYYFKTLCALKKYEEALIEAARCLTLKIRKDDLLNSLPDKYHNRLDALQKIKPRHFLIAPKECYQNTMFNRMCNIGILLQRMGHKVEYIFNEANETDTGTIQVHNYILRNYYMYTDCENYKYQSKMYDLNRILTQYSINQFVKELANNQKLYILAKEEKVIRNIEKSNLIQTIFWDFSNPYDSESRFLYNTKIIDEMYDKSSYIFTESIEKYNTLVNSYGLDKVKMINNTDKQGYYIMNETANLSQLYTYKSDIFMTIDALLKIDSIEKICNVQ